MRLFLLCLIVFTYASAFAQKKSSQQTTSLQSALAILWKFQIKTPFIASPVSDATQTYVGGLDSVLYALELSSGKLKWKFRTNGEIRSSVSINSNSIYLSGGDGVLYCLDKNTGKVNWQFRTLGGLLGERKYDFADYFYSTPVLYQNKLFFGAGDGRVYAINPDSGKLIWSYQANDIVHTTPAFSDNKLFVGSFDGHLYALNTNDGSLLWKFKSVGHRYFPKGEMMGSPVVANNLVLIGSRDYNLYALDVNQGYCHWNKQFPFGWAMALTPNDSIVYVGTSDDRLIAAIDVASGVTRWSTPTQFNIFGPAAITSTKGYVGTLMGKVFCIDLKTGKTEWIFVTERYTQNKSKYFKDDDSFRDDIGKLIKSPIDFIQMEYNVGAFFSTPSIAGTLLITSSADGNVYALKLP
jgi:eukaryotic-like serine/threonine-protein kinase